MSLFASPPPPLPGHVFALEALVVEHVDALQLQIVVAHIAAVGVDAVLGADRFPELLANL